MGTAHNIYAQIVGNEIVNIITSPINDGGFPKAAYITRMVYGDEAFIVDCKQYLCGIGDRYHDGTFWVIDPETKEEVPAEYIPTQEQEVAQLKAENEELTLALAEIIGGAL